jgi:hypothetical protein
MESQNVSVPPKKKHLISYRAWVMILVIAIIANLRPVPGANIDYMAGKFLGTVLIVAAIWAIVILIIRQISSRRKAMHE